MKVSLNWLKDYIDIDLDPVKVGEILTDIGLEVEGMEEVETIKGGMEGIVIGYVKEQGAHPDADRLSVTKVDIGTGQDLHIVCGAPNVAAGQKVLVAQVGTTMYSAEGEAWTIKKGKIRGEVSEGMICSEDEVGLGNDHSGIVVLPDDAQIGTLARDYYQIEKDYVYEIGLTPNRSDATNHLGVAKDLLAALSINYEHQGSLRLPSVDAFHVDNHDMPIDVVVENTEACPRYTGVVIKGVTIKESPEWLKNRLRSIGVRPISNVVDITNFILHELGQPLHAFDLDEIAGQKIIVKNLPKGSSFLSLDEVDRTLLDSDLMICDGDSKGMCIGGVFGGIRSGIKEMTKNIFLESAHFNAKSIRRSSMHHQLRTDAAKVFEKGSDPNVTLYALKRAILMIQELAGGEIASEVVDIYPQPILPLEIEISYSRIKRLIGMDIPHEEIKAILAVLEMEIKAETEQTLSITVPTNKADVTREVDVIEEILRIYGFNKVEIPAQITTAIVVGAYPDPTTIRNKIGDSLAANGFQEMMAVSLSESRYYQKVLSDVNDKELVYINNTSNIHLDIMRPEMVISGLEAVLHNQNRQQSNVKLFEFGKTYRHGEDRIVESQHLSLFMAGQRHPENWLNTPKHEVTFYSLKSLVVNVLSRIGLNTYQETAIKKEPFSFALQYHRGQQVLVEFGKVDPRIVKKMDIRGTVFYADFNWNALLKIAVKQQVSIEEINKFPSTRRDLALVIDNSVKFQDIVAIARKAGKKLIKEINLFDVYENTKQLGKGKKSYAVSFLFEDPTKTLKDKEVDKVMNKLMQSYQQELGAEIRGL